jgi:superfamily I DNA and/or RNA helicase
MEMKDVGVVTPYRKQVQKLKKLFTAREFDSVKVGSVEEF